MFLLLCSIGIIIQLYMYIVPHAYMSELLISFLPYGIGMSFLIIIFSLLKLVIQRKSVWSIITRSIITIAYILSCIRYLSTYISTYYTHPEQPSTSIPSDISFLYSNIYYKNESLSWLIQMIESQQPDVILLVEYTKQHNEVLAALLKQDYPYVSRYIGGKWYDGDVIYSRYPLKKIKHDIYPGSFSHVSINYEWKEVDFALIHTSAPISEHFFNMRNEQLSDLSRLMSAYYQERKRDKNIILLWDFNITPRSPYYKTFSTQMNTIWLYNISNNIVKTQYNNLVPYTRCHQEAKIFCSHIDHVRSNNTSMKLQKITISWSDHYGFVGTL